jgi:hypothetical protein
MRHDFLLLMWTASSVNASPHLATAYAVGHFSSFVVRIVLVPSALKVICKESFRMDAAVQSQKPRPALDAPLDDIMRGASPVVVLNAGAKCRGLIASVSEIRVSVQVFAQIFFDELGCAPQFVDWQSVAVIGGSAVCEAVIAQQMDAGIHAPSTFCV